MDEGKKCPTYGGFPVGKRVCCMPSVKIAIGAILFLLTFFLEPEAVKTLWLVLTGSLIVVGIVFLVRMKAVSKTGE